MVIPFTQTVLIKICQGHNEIPSRFYSNSTSFFMPDKDVQQDELIAVGVRKSSNTFLNT